MSPGLECIESNYRGGFNSRRRSISILFMGNAILGSDKIPYLFKGMINSK